MTRPSVLLFFSLSLAAIFFGGFLKLSSEFREGETDRLDRHILAVVVDHRSGRATPVARGISAAGSPRSIGLLALFALTLLVLNGQKREARYLGAGAAGAALLTLALKNIFSRPRPLDIRVLESADGFSYPSGHSLGSAAVFLLAAFLLTRNVTNRAGRVAAMGAALMLSAAVAASRVYLGVHFPSDVISGMMVGCGWACFLAGLYLYNEI